ncbi:hypothetical protein HX056_00990 [Myroides odoratimimus]|uniref:hypothetical protein n=1 Tax=Myroides odoratimimus TaxID=76832 RepID=UPI002577B3DB|nr:hypothetical protein [Myroides odoratimimus]MDM1441914.1 hypothetical protein [Myroides odoratimimus]
MGETILTSFIGAVLALYLNYYYDQHKEKTELELIRLGLLDIFKINILPSLKILSLQHDEVVSKKENEKTTFIISHSFIHFLDIDFQNYLDKNKVLSILGEKKIKPSLLYNIHKNLIYLKNNNTRNIMIDFQKEENIILGEYNNKISHINLLDVHHNKYSELKFELDKKNYEIDRLNAKTISELNTTSTILNLTINMIEEIIASLK